MNRRWSCRMGIRLESQFAENIEGKSITVIKEICKDTLAEKDGRLKAGDRVLMVSHKKTTLKSPHYDCPNNVCVIYRLTMRLLTRELLKRLLT